MGPQHGIPEVENEDSRLTWGRRGSLQIPEKGGVLRNTALRRQQAACSCWGCRAKDREGPAGGCCRLGAMLREPRIGRNGWGFC